jgi:hypoxanthine-guanine phosphoribosyltransferase
MRGDLERVLFDEPAINRRLDELAEQTSNDWRDRKLTVIAVLIGYGLDFMEGYRNLSYIGVLRKELIAELRG